MLKETDATDGESASSVMTIYHNPGCGTSRNVLKAIVDSGVEPKIVEYLSVGWSREQLGRLLARMGVGPRDVLRVRGTAAHALGLTNPAVSEDDIVQAMIDNPILVERPIVESPKGARLCRPWEKVRDLL